MQSGSPFAYPTTLHAFAGSGRNAQSNTNMTNQIEVLGMIMFSPKAQGGYRTLREGARISSDIADLNLPTDGKRGCCVWHEANSAGRHLMGSRQQLRIMHLHATTQGEAVTIRSPAPECRSLGRPNGDRARPIDGLRLALDTNGAIV
jgi:hypothetical protein